VPEREPTLIIRGPDEVPAVDRIEVDGEDLRVFLRI
jgi:hypothetical protein